MLKVKVNYALRLSAASYLYKILECNVYITVLKLLHKNYTTRITVISRIQENRVLKKASSQVFL